jgi:hypothetical protein
MKGSRPISLCGISVARAGCIADNEARRACLREAPRASNNDRSARIAHPPARSVPAAPELSHSRPQTDALGAWVVSLSHSGPAKDGTAERAHTEWLSAELDRNPVHYSQQISTNLSGSEDAFLLGVLGSNFDDHGHGRGSRPQKVPCAVSAGRSSSCYRAGLITRCNSDSPTAASGASKLPALRERG